MLAKFIWKIPLKISIRINKRKFVSTVINVFYNNKCYKNKQTGKCVQFLYIILFVYVAIYKQDFKMYICISKTLANHIHET